MSYIQNPAVPFGFQVYRGTSLRSTQVYVPASDGTAIFIGDMVKAVAGVNAVDGRAYVSAASISADSQYLVGAVLSVTPDVKSDNITYRVASTGAHLLVADHPMQTFVGVMVGTPSATAWKTADIDVSNAGNVVTGISGQGVVVGTSTSAAKQLGIVEAYLDDPSVTTGLNEEVRVKINLHQMGQAAPGV